MSHAIVTVQQHHAGPLLQHANVGAQLDPAGANALRVLRQPNHPMTVRTLQIGFRHQRCDGKRIRIVQPELSKRCGDEIPKRGKTNARRRRCHGDDSRVRVECGAIMRRAEQLFLVGCGSAEIPRPETIDVNAHTQVTVRAAAIDLVKHSEVGQLIIRD